MENPGSRNVRNTALVLSRAAPLVALTAFSSLASEKCDHLTPFGQPAHWSPATDVGFASAPDWTVICHTGQVVAFNPDHNVSDWVAFRLRREELLNPKTERKKAFRQDPDVPEGHRVVYADYWKTGYQRGHLAPAASMKWSKDAMRDSFLMSNMAPQIGPGFNGGIWGVLERKMRRWACERGRLYVVTGPLYETRPVTKLSADKDDDGADDNGVLVDVPSHFFKLALDPKRMEAIAFILANRRLETQDLHRYLRSIDEIEARARHDFLTGIEDGPEQVIESHVQPKLWDEPEGAECVALK